MNLSHAYGAPPPAEDARALLLRRARRSASRSSTPPRCTASAPTRRWSARCWRRTARQFVLASKCGMHGSAGRQARDRRPARDAQAELRGEPASACAPTSSTSTTCTAGTRRVPIEDSVGALAELVRAGKVARDRPVGGVGRDAAPRPRGAPDRRAADRILAVDAQPRDRRARRLPRDSARPSSPSARWRAASSPARCATSTALRREGHPPQHAALRAGRTTPPTCTLLDRPTPPSPREVGCTPAQLALAWLLARGEHIIPIPGTTQHRPPGRGPGRGGRCSSTPALLAAARRADQPADTVQRPALQRRHAGRGRHRAVLKRGAHRDTPAFLARPPAGARRAGLRRRVGRPARAGRLPRPADHAGRALRRPAASPT